jgi:hypothetical protein
MATYIAEGSGTLGLWARSNGTWVKLGTTPFYAYNTFGTGGLKTLSWYTTASISAPGGIDAFRVTIDDVGSITAFNSVSWVTQASSGTRSATPNGEHIIATVRPQ